MKRWIGIGLAALLLLSACSKAPEQTTQREPVEFSDGAVVHNGPDGSVSRVDISNGENSPAGSNSSADRPMLDEPIAEDISVDELVSEYAVKQVHYVDKVGTILNCVFRVPQVNLPSYDAQEVSEEVLELAKEVVLAAQAAAEEKSGLLDQGMDYETWTQDRMLVLRVTVDNLWDCDRYFVYVFDLDTGVRLDTAGIAQRLGLNADDLAEKLAQAVEREYRVTYEGMEDMDGRFYEMQLSRTIELENLNNAQIYPSESGTLMVVADIYSLAGADSYVHNFPLEG